MIKLGENLRDVTRAGGNYRSHFVVLDTFLFRSAVSLT